MSPGTLDALAAVEQLLRSHMGLEPKTLGRDHIAQALDSRRSSLGLEVSAYLHQLADNEEELRALVDAVVVPETWFFRDRAAFRYLRRQAVSQTTRPLRVLSVPCCTGEEPYSIAMTLLDAGLDREEFEIVATDISPAALATAATGRYADVSFRESHPEFVALTELFCRRDGDCRIVDETVRGTVRFLRANLAAPHFLDAEPPFHAIFCRNLFIYLDQRARGTALTHLRRLLRPDGVVYFSVVEAGFLVDSGFRRMSEESPSAFTLPALAESVVRAPSKRRPAPRHIPQDAVSRAPAVEEIADVLTRARQAADAGRLEEAAALCTALTAQGTPRADVWCLLGVVRQAQGNVDEAGRCFQRVLYLDPRHHEALIHMALLARRRGDERLAENFLRRIDQV
jgi:chemotaxis protein methyltransferase WspC